MRVDSGDRLGFSPTDLAAFVACPHLNWLQVRVARGDLPKPFRHNPHADLIRAKGEQHEAAFHASLDGEVTSIDTEQPFDAAARTTEQAIRDSAPFIYQATFAHDGWRGRADFLFRQPDGGYEALDTKLARHARPEHVLQLCFYTEQIARIQGRLPERMHVVAGTGERESFRPQDFLAYYHRLKRRFLAAVESEDEPYPYPVEHCALCEFLARCKERWNRDDHLSLVAAIRRTQVELLTEHGIPTLEALAESPPDTRVRRIRPETLAKLRHQAELQLHRRRTGEHSVDLLPLEEERGFALLPRPSDGDIWLDLEGDPWYEPARGLEFLFGWVTLEDGEPRYECLWGRDRDQERQAFERLLDLIRERRRHFPDLHVYHYAAYERTALTRLMGEHGTREVELDDLLRGEVLVDLFRVTRQALRASLPSYSIKDVEELYGFERTAEVSGGGESVVAFEQWLELGDDALLEGIRAYNEEDCRSLYELHRWLLGLRPAELAWRPPPEEREPSEEAQERLDERERLRAELLAGAEEGEPRRLLAHLLEYHRREEKPQWWEYFHHLSLDEGELIEDGDTIGGIEWDGAEPVRDKQPLVYTLTFPAQEHKIGGDAVDPATERSPGKIRIDDERGLISLRRSVQRADEPLPKALVPGRPIPTWEQRDALLRFAKSPERYPALVEILGRRPPRARPEGTPIEAAASLDGSYLFVQGPPGSGKTYEGARTAVELMRRGQRIGVTALSHRAINRFLEEVEEAALEQGFDFKGRKRSGEEETRFEGRGLIDNGWENAEMLDPELQLLAGTAWLFARAELEVWIETLFIDEGGQVALADAIAVGTAARNLVLLGDPNQLAQVSQGSHPPGANASVLAHLLGEDETVREGMGLFLEQTWRLRPELCEFVSEAFYEGRLEPAEVCRRRSLELGNGVRFLPVEHRSHRSASPEEAGVVRAEIERLVGTAYVDERGERPLRYSDVVVVAPYNAQVRCLREALPEAVRVGTVDKFQGQEAAVVFFSMASSSGEDVPRGMEFLFSRNRLNVAVSRARCLAYLVASPRLLEVSCRTVEQMRLANALCLLVERAEVTTRAARS